MDASDRGLGAVLTQEIGGEERPVLYISRKLSKRETSRPESGGGGMWRGGRGSAKSAAGERLRRQR